MNREDIIRMAREAAEGSTWKPGTGNEHVVEYLEHFAAFVAAAEREACAQILDGVDSYANPMTANDCADAIRARGQA